MNNIRLLDDFLLYFKERAKYLLNKQYQEQLFFEAPFMNFDETDVLENKKKIFAEQIALSKIPITNHLNEQVYLTKKEFSCVKNLVSESTVKEAAKKWELHQRL